MVTINKNVDFDDIEISNQIIYKSLGYGRGDRLTSRTRNLVEGYARQANDLVDPIYAYVIRKVESVRKGYVYVEGTGIFRGRVVSDLLRDCSKVAIFVATIGNHLEDMSRQMAEDGLMLQAAVLDAIGSVSIDRMAEYIRLQVDEMAARDGMVISPRLSPGYCDWSIRQQKEIFRIVNAQKTGIALTQDFLMVPQKSVSGVIGIGSNLAIRDYNPCLTCKQRDCPGRRK